MMLRPAANCDRAMVSNKLQIRDRASVAGARGTEDAAKNLGGRCAEEAASRHVLLFSSVPAAKA